LHEPGNVDELHCRGHDLLRLHDLRDAREPRVGHFHHADVGLHRAKRIVFCRCTGRGERIEKRGLPDIGKTDDTKLEHRGNLNGGDTVNATSDRSVGLRIAAYSALILFFELAFIRYTAGYVRVFSFYLNFVLIATFLGMGVGLLSARHVERLRWLAVPAT